MSRRSRRELAHRLIILVSHLLKWQAQPHYRSSSWSATIINQREAIQRRLRDSPSLRPLLDETLSRIYPYAVQTAVKETRIANSEFADACPFTPAQILSDSFLPE